MGHSRHSEDNLFLVPDNIMSRKEECASEPRHGVGYSHVPLSPHPLNREAKGKGCFPQTSREWKGSRGSPEEVTKEVEGNWPFFPTAATQSGPAGVTKSLFPRDTTPERQRDITSFFPDHPPPRGGGIPVQCLPKAQLVPPQLTQLPKAEIWDSVPPFCTPLNPHQFPGFPAVP